MLVIFEVRGMINDIVWVFEKINNYVKRRFYRVILELYYGVILDKKVIWENLRKMLNKRIVYKYFLMRIYIGWFIRYRKFL